MSCLVQGVRWVNCEDGMSFEEECKVILRWWRNSNGNEDPTVKKERMVKHVFVPSIMLLTKAVLVVYSDDVKVVQIRSRYRNNACI